MLEKVVLGLRTETESRLHAALQRLDQDIMEHDVQVAHTVCGESAQETCHPEILFITDSAAQYDIWHEQGNYVLPYRHEENKGERFPGAEYMIERIEDIDYEVVDMAYRRLAGIPWEIFRTRRCIVRETIVEDVDSLYDIYEEPAITEYMEGLYEDRDAEIAYVQDYRRRMYGFYGYGIWTILTRKDEKVIGRAGISWREEFDVPELGFVIGVPWQRQGYAYEVCTEILKYAWKEIGFKQMQALVMEHNRKSAALCRKLGFEDSGITEIGGVRYILYRMQLRCK